MDKVIARLERKKAALQDKIVDLEVDNDLLNGLLVDKEKEIYHFKAKVEDMTAEKYQYKKTENAELKYINKVAELEAELKFKDEELDESRTMLR